MRVKWVMSCEAYGLNSEGAFIIVNPETNTSPVESFPAPDAWLTLVACLTVSYDEHVPTDIHRLEWTVVDPVGVTVTEGRYVWAFEPRSPWWKRESKLEPAHLIPIRAEFHADEAGTYEFRFSLDGTPTYVHRHDFVRTTSLFGTEDD